MEANLKLLKKKRIAHFGNKMAKVNFDEPKLPPDDFVYNIIKDMDSSKNVISYQQLQEFRSKKRQSKNKDQKPSNSSMPDNYNNQAKKILPKKSFPLMKKCQTSLKYLEKNRCIPKPRAHVGFVPKPPVKPISHAEQSTSKFECQNTSKVKSKKIQSKAYSKILQTNFEINNDFQRKSCESKDFTTQEVEISDNLSSSEDDNAFENFVQKVNQEVADSSDSDSRLIIRRKKSRKRSKQEGKKLKINSLSSNVNNRHVAKITSIPLSDSSECEETFEVNRPKGICVSIKAIGSAKRYADSPERFQKRVCKDGIESYNSESLSEDASGTFNYDSSDDEPNVETSSVNSVESTNGKEVTVCAVNCDSTDNEFCVGTSSVNSFRALIEKEETVCAVNADLQCNTNTKTLNNLPLNKVQTNGVPDETNALKHELIPCFVRLQRDPTIDEKSSTLCSNFPPTSNTGNCFEDDCIVISDDSDTNEVSTSDSIPSHVMNKSCESLDLSLNTQKLGTEVLESHTDSSSIQGRKDESDDCVFMFEIPKVGLSNQIKDSNCISNSLSSKSLTHIPMSKSTASLSSDIESPNEVKSVTPVIESLNLPILNTKTNNESALVLGNSKSNTDVKIEELNSGNSSNSGTTDSGSYCHEDASETFEIPELNVKIVTVVSLGESSDPPVIEAKDLNGIEVIDLLDDDSKPLEENRSSEDEKVLDVVDPFNTSQEKTIQCNDTEKVTENTVVSCNSTTGNNEQSSCENHPADIEQIYHTINFDHLKAAIDTVYSKSESSNVVENSVFNELPDLSSPMIICDLDGQREREVSSEIIILEDEALQKTNSSSFSAENRTSTTICNPTQENKVPVASFPNSKDPLHKSGNGGNVPLNTFLTEPVQNMIQQGSSQDATPHAENRVPFADVNLKLEHINDSNNMSNQFNIQEIVKQEIPHAKGRKRSHSHIQEMKHAVLENSLDGLDALTTLLVYEMNDTNQRFPSLVSLYRKELTKYEQIKSTEINVSAGLKLLHEKQGKKVAHLRHALEVLLPPGGSFRNTEREECKTQMNTADIKNESMNKVEVNKSKSLKINELEESKSENLNTVQINKNESVNKDANKIKSVFKLNKNETANKEANIIENMDTVMVNKNNTMTKIKVEDTTPILPKISAKTSVKFNSAGKSKEELLKMITKYKCSQCQKPATAACQGCNEAYFCSPECGERSWEKGHKSICKR